MRTNTLRALAVVVFALLAGCDSDTASTAPRAIDPDLSVSASRKTYVQIERLANPLVSEVMVLKARHPAYSRFSSASGSE